MQEPDWGGLADHWWVACAEEDLKGPRPAARTVLGTKLAIFPGAGGARAALVDACPHRGAPLSAGRRLAEGRVQCAYHGWTFDGAGRCVAVPGLAASSTSRGSNALAWEARQEDGLVWVRRQPAGGADVPAPWPIAHAREPGVVTFRLQATLEATLQAAVENILDVPHTAFVHAGLFRRPERRAPVEVVVRRGATSAEAEFLGEPPPSGLVGRILAPRGGTVEHVDRFTLPCVAEVHYALGRRSIRTTHLLTPQTPTRTSLVVTVSIRPRALGLALLPFLRPFARRILAQDARILALASGTSDPDATAPQRHASTDLDALGAHVAQLLREARERTPPRGAPHHEKRFGLEV